MSKRTYPIGLMFSSTGPYSTVSNSMLNGALLAVAEVNAAGIVALDAVLADPGGDLTRYAPITADLLAADVRHVVGCYTSSSRKEVIPVFEKYDGMLWYPSHYEGFESSNNVVYTGAAPNQHIIPLINYMMSNFGNRTCCVGSNYIWAWENGRILREVVQARGGRVLAERYLPVGETDLRQIVETILSLRPNFVFSSLIGISGYEFFRAIRESFAVQGLHQPSIIPVASCNLSEPELMDVVSDARDGHISSSVYFSTVRTPQNDAFVTNYAAAHPSMPWTSADGEASYIAVKLLAQAITEAGTDEVSAVRTALNGGRLDAPQGGIRVDGETMHLYLTPRIGRSRSDGSFDVIWQEAAPVQPDPYLVRFSATDWVAPAARLHVVR